MFKGIFIKKKYEFLSFFFYLEKYQFCNFYKDLSILNNYCNIIFIVKYNRIHVDIMTSKCCEPIHQQIVLAFIFIILKLIYFTHEEQLIPEAKIAFVKEKHGRGNGEQGFKRRHLERSQGKWLKAFVINIELYNFLEAEVWATLHELKIVPRRRDIIGCSWRLTQPKFATISHPLNTVDFSARM